MRTKSVADSGRSRSQRNERQRDTRRADNSNVRGQNRRGNSETVQRPSPARAGDGVSVSREASSPVEQVRSEVQNFAENFFADEPADLGSQAPDAAGAVEAPASVEGLVEAASLMAGPVAAMDSDVLGDIVGLAAPAGASATLAEEVNPGLRGARVVSGLAGGALSVLSAGQAIESAVVDGDGLEAASHASGAAAGAFELLGRAGGASSALARGAGLAGRLAPGVGLAAGVLSAATTLRDADSANDYVRAALEAASGAVSLVPGLGTVAGLGLSLVSLAFRDRR